MVFAPNIAPAKHNNLIVTPALGLIEVQLIWSSIIFYKKAEAS